MNTHPFLDNSAGDVLLPFPELLFPFQSGLETNSPFRKNIGPVWSTLYYNLPYKNYIILLFYYHLPINCWFSGGTSSDQPTWLIPKKPQLKLARSHPVLEMLDLPRLGGAFSLSCKNWMANIPEKKTSYLGFLVKSKQKYAISIDRSTKF